jgi:DNA-binding MarR family transcriptional regulator
VRAGMGQANFKPQTVAQIARNMGQARQSVQRVADVLAREGLVNYTNNTQDKRTQLLAVTSRGEAVIAEINARNAVWMQHITPKLGADNLALLARQMEQIATVLEQSVTFFGSTKSVKVKGTMDGVAFQTAFMPWGDGTQFLPVSKKLLKAMQAQPGDVIEVSLEERL